ncbi:MAG: hypothetical protein ACYC1W_00825 [Gemmatimonadaceae bacterium]
MDANTVAAITAIAALLTGIATLLTIREMRLQRRVQFRPELIAEDVEFLAIRSLDDARGKITLAPPYVSLRDGNPWRGAIPLRIHNVGTGVARDVSAEWSFDRPKFAAVLAPFSQLLGGELRISGDLVERRGSENSGWASSGNARHRLGAIVPGQSQTGTELGVDFAYSQMLREYFATKDVAFDAPGELPPELSLTLRYRDIEGRAHSKVLRIALQPILDTDMDRDTGESVVAIGMGQLLVADA